MTAGDRMSLVEVLLHVAGLVGHTKNAKAEIRASVKAGKLGLVAGELTVVDEAVFAGSLFPSSAARPVAIANAELPADCVIQAEVNFETGIIMRRQKREEPVEHGRRLQLPAFAARNVTALRRAVERLWPPQWGSVAVAQKTTNKVQEASEGVADKPRSRNLTSTEWRRALTYLKDTPDKTRDNQQAELLRQFPHMTDDQWRVLCKQAPRRPGRRRENPAK